MPSSRVSTSRQIARRTLGRHYQGTRDGRVGTARPSSCPAQLPPFTATRLAPDRRGSNMFQILDLSVGQARRGHRDGRSHRGVPDYIRRSRLFAGGPIACRGRSPPELDSLLPTRGGYVEVLLRRAPGMCLTSVSRAHLRGRETGFALRSRFACLREFLVAPVHAPSRLESTAGFI